MGRSQGKIGFGLLCKSGGDPLRRGGFSDSERERGGGLVFVCVQKRGIIKKEV